MTRNLPLPLVSVIIPCHNKADTIKRAIDSVKAQTLNNLECIVINDASSDDSERVILETIENDARFSYEKVNYHNVALVRNHGIAKARGIYICPLDGDDWLEPTFLEVCVEALEKDRSLGIAYTGLMSHNPDGRVGISQWPGDWDFDQQLRAHHNQVPTCNVFRRVMWERLGGYRQRYAPRGAGAEDAEFWLRSGAYGFKAAKVTGAPLFNYSQFSGQVSGNWDYISKIDYTLWHPWCRDKQHPLASYATPENWSHPVRAYDQPLVSVIIPVGPGHEREVVNALDSLEAQTMRKWEAIVVDDTASPDFFDSIRIPYPFVRYVRAYDAFTVTEGSGLKPRGAGHARNLGAEVARAPFLVFLDADDWLYPECLEKMLMAWNETQSIIYTDYVGKAIVDDPGALAQDLQDRLYQYDDAKQEAVIGYRAHDYDCARAIRQPEGARPWVWCNVTALIPKSWHDIIGGFDETMQSWEDVDYHYRLARAGYCYQRIEEELMVYRFYSGTRRETGRQNNENLVQYMRQKYEGDEPMGCGSCPGGGKAVKYNTPPPASPFQAAMDASRGPAQYALVEGGTVAINDEDFVRARYVTGHGGDHPVTGNGTHIKYGLLNNGRILPVHKNDLGPAGMGGTFQAIQEQGVRLPDRQPVQTPAPVTLPGVEVKAQPAPPPAPVPVEPLEKETPEPLPPFEFDPEVVLKTIDSLQKFMDGPHGSPHWYSVLLDLEREGKNRKGAIDRLEAALG